MESEAQLVPASPQIVCTSDAIGGVCNPPRRILKRRFVNEALPDVEQFLVADFMGPRHDGLEADIRPDPKQGEQEAPGDFFRRQGLP